MVEFLSSHVHGQLVLRFFFRNWVINEDLWVYWGKDVDSWVDNWYELLFLFEANATFIRDMLTSWRQGYTINGTELLDSCIFGMINMFARHISVKVCYHNAYTFVYCSKTPVHVNDAIFPFDFYWLPQMSQCRLLPSKQGQFWLQNQLNASCRVYITQHCSFTSGILKLAVI